MSVSVTTIGLIFMVYTTSKSKNEYMMFLTNTVKLLQMKCVNGEGEGDEIPRVRLLVHGLKSEQII